MLLESVSNFTIYTPLVKFGSATFFVSTMFSSFFKTFLPKILKIEMFTFSLLNPVNFKLVLLV